MPKKKKKEVFEVVENNEVVDFRPSPDPSTFKTQLVSMASMEAAKRILDGTASDTLLIHWLKSGDNNEKQELEKEKLRADIDLANAKIEQLESSSNVDADFAAAMEAFKGYQGKQ